MAPPLRDDHETRRSATGSLSSFWAELVECRGDLASVLELIVRRVAEVVGETAVLTVLAEDGEHLVPEASYHPDPDVASFIHETIGTTPFAIGQGIVGRVAQDRRPAVLNGLAPEVITGLVARPSRPFARVHPIRALLIVPMVASGELVGTLGLVRLESDEPYSNDDVVAVEAMAERAAIAIYDAQERPTVLGAAEYEALYRNSADGMLFTSPDGRVLAANPAACKILGLTERQICRLGRGGLMMADDPATQRAVQERSRVGSVRAVVPMRRGNGLLFTADLTSAIFATAEGELRTCVIFRDVTAQASERDELSRHVEALEAASQRDPLTDLYNQRGFAAAAEEALAIARRQGRRAQLAYLDLDDFKGLNDTYGHGVGDVALRRFGHAIAEVVREADVCARVGGDEFVVLMVSADDGDASAAISRLRAVVEGGSDEAAATGAATVPPTPFSVGIVEYDPWSGESLEHLVERADREMYQAKARRRFAPEA